MLLPNLSNFSDADQFGVLLVMTKMFSEEQLHGVLPLFKNSDSLAVKYLIDEIANRLQLKDPQNKQRGYIDPEMVEEIHS